MSGVPTEAEWNRKQIWTTRYLRSLRGKNQPITSIQTGSGVFGGFIFLTVEFLFFLNSFYSKVNLK